MSHLTLTISRDWRQGSDSNLQPTIGQAIKVERKNCGRETSIINVLPTPRAWLKEISKHQRAAQEVRPSVLAVRDQHSICATRCGQCGDNLIAPESSAYVSYGRDIEGHISHLWCCSNCGYQFETSLCFATSDPVRKINKPQLGPGVMS